MTRRVFVWVRENWRSGASKPEKKNEKHGRKKMGISRPSPDGGVKRMANLWEDRKARESGVPTVSRWKQEKLGTFLDINYY